MASHLWIPRLGMGPLDQKDHFFSIDFFKLGPQFLCSFVLFFFIRFFVLLK